MKSKASGAKYLVLFCAPVLFLAVAPTMQRAVFKARDGAQATQELAQWSRNPRLSIEPLIARGADVDVRDQSGEPVLHTAVSRSRGEVELLLNHGADVNAPGASGGTALIHAAQDGKVDVVRLLLNRKAAVDVEATVPRQGQHTALSIAKDSMGGATSPVVVGNYRKIIKMLKAAGAKE